MPKGRRVDGKRALIAAFRDWLADSNAETIGDTSGYHGSFWLYSNISGHEVRFAADTTREGVQRVVDSLAGDVERPWRVVANQRGVVNKLVIGERGEAGWYAYLARPLPHEGEI